MQREQSMDRLASYYLSCYLEVEGRAKGKARSHQYAVSGFVEIRILKLCGIAITFSRGAFSRRPPSMPVHFWVSGFVVRASAERGVSFCSSAFSVPGPTR